MQLHQPKTKNQPRSTFRFVAIKQAHTLTHTHMYGLGTHTAALTRTPQNINLEQLKKCIGGDYRLKYNTIALR